MIKTHLTAKRRRENDNREYPGNVAMVESCVNSLCKSFIGLLMVKKKGDERMNNKELVEKIMKEFKVSDIVVNGGINLSGFEKALNRMAEEKNKEHEKIGCTDCYQLLQECRKKDKQIAELKDEIDDIKKHSKASRSMKRVLERNASLKAEIEKLKKETGE